MSFADKYFQKYDSFDNFISDEPESNLNIVTVIPCFNEKDLNKTLHSLLNCKKPDCSVEIIVVINSGENSSKEIILQNEVTFNEAKTFSEKYSQKCFKFHAINVKNLPEKFAGVGLARKIGMDFAAFRFKKIDKPNGIITGFDADTITKENYFTEIEEFFIENKTANACSIHFEHPTEGNDFDEDIYSKIIKYELHLRYFINALRKINFPFAYQTIGSSFAVKAEIYTKQGGMNRRKAGEDFYFLQKIIQLGSYFDLNSTTVIPSPRTSDRVPFGTGAAIKKMQENNETDYLTYNFQAFEDLNLLFKNKLQFFDSYFVENLPDSILEFLKLNNFETDLLKIKENSPNTKIFVKRFYDWFNAFRVIKFLNFAHENFYEKIPVNFAVKKLFDENICNTIINYSDKKLLNLLRQTDKNTIYKSKII